LPKEILASKVLAVIRKPHAIPLYDLVGNGHLPRDSISF